MPTTISATGGVPFPHDPARTAIVMMYREPGMIADRVLPHTPPLGKSEFKYWKYLIGDAFIVPDVSLGRKSMPNMAEFEGQEVTDSTLHYGLRDSVPQEDVDAAGATPSSMAEWANPVDQGTIQLTHLLKLAREIRVANLVFSADSYPAGYKVTVAAAERFDANSSSPLATLETALTTPIFRPNVVVFGQQVWSAFRQHADVVKATNSASFGAAGDTGYASRRAVADLLEVDEVLVGRSRVASNKEGQNLALTRTWGKSVACIYRGAYGMGDASPGGMMGSEKQEMDGNLVSDNKRPTFGFTALYEELMAYSRFNEAIGIKGATELIVRESCREVISGGEFGYLIGGAVG